MELISAKFIFEEVSVWCKKFKDGRMAFNDEPEKNRGISKSSHTDENCIILDLLIRVDLNMTVFESEEVIGIPESCVNYRSCSRINTIR